MNHIPRFRNIFVPMDTPDRDCITVHSGRCCAPLLVDTCQFSVFLGRPDNIHRNRYLKIAVSVLGVCACKVVVVVYLAGRGIGREVDMLVFRGRFRRGTVWLYRLFLGDRQRDRCCLNCGHACLKIIINFKSCSSNFNRHFLENRASNANLL